MWTLALLLVGLAGLWFGTEIVVRAAVELGGRLGFSERFLGLTVLAVGTDLPELVVAIDGGVHQLRGVEASGVVVGNAIGSAITQGSLVLGIAGLIHYLPLAPRQIRRHGLVLLLLIGVVGLLGANGTLDRFEAGALLLLYVIYSRALMRSEGAMTKLRAAPKAGTFWIAGRIAAGLAVVMVAAELVVDGAVEIAHVWGMSQSMIGVVLIGAGTSLPELALSISAAAKGRVGLSIGNVIGSNVFDLLVPIGASGLIHPLAFERGTLLLDLPFLALITILGFAFFWSRRGLQRHEAAVLVAAYVGFAAVRIGLN